MNSAYYLKEIETSDIENIHRGLSDPEITRYYDVHFETLEDTREQMDWYRDLKKNGTGIWWGIHDAAGQFCGAAGFNNLIREHKKAEIGFWLLKEYWGKGIFKVIMSQLYRKAFQELGLNRIEGLVESENLKCKKAVEKSGFTYEGCMREWEIKEGKSIDVAIYSMLRSDWENLQNKGAI